jgi:uncharacterized FlaG/YvyC family protein
MTINVTQPLISADAGYAPRSSTATMSSSRTGSSSTAATQLDAGEPASVPQAFAQIEAHLTSLTTPPTFRVDYLSGLDVMTVRAASTGEVVFQIPDIKAVHLARLIKETGSLDSLALLDTQA